MQDWFRNKGKYLFGAALVLILAWILAGPMEEDASRRAHQTPTAVLVVLPASTPTSILPSGMDAVNLVVTVNEVVGVDGLVCPLKPAQFAQVKGCSTVPPLPTPEHGSP